MSFAHGVWAQPSGLGQRVANTTLQRPSLDSTLLDTDAINLLSAWITNGLANYRSFADWQFAYFNSTNALDAAPDADPDGDGTRNFLEYLTGTDPLTAGDAWKINVRQTGDTVEISFLQIANRGFQVESASSLAMPISWEPLDVPANRLWFSPTNFSATISDAITNAPFKFYRVRVVEP